MGIESVGQGCRLWVATGMEGADRCLSLNADLLRACGAWSEEMGVGVASLAGAREVVVSLWHT